MRCRWKRREPAPGCQLSKSLFVQVRDQQIERSLDNYGQISRGIGVTHQVAGELELFLELRCRVELKAVSGRGERLETPCWSGRGSTRRCEGPSRRQFSNRAFHVGSRCEVCQELEELSFGLAARAIQ